MCLVDLTHCHLRVANCDLKDFKQCFGQKVERSLDKVPYDANGFIKQRILSLGIENLQKGFWERKSAKIMSLGIENLQKRFLGKENLQKKFLGMENLQKKVLGDGKSAKKVLGDGKPAKKVLSLGIENLQKFCHWG